MTTIAIYWRKNSLQCIISVLLDVPNRYSSRGGHCFCYIAEFYFTS